MKNTHILIFSDEYEEKLDFIFNYITKKVFNITKTDLLGITCYDKIDALYNEYSHYDQKGKVAK